jgi:endonuclease/exonuclease/phosphatase family metal-dependent hydrolase
MRYSHRMINDFRSPRFFLVLSMIIMWNVFCVPIHGAQSISIAALTWNVGNKTVKDKIAEGLSQEIEKLGSPDVIVVGTQEEMAKNGEELKDKLLHQFGKNSYYIAAENAHTTFAGANNAVKTAALAVTQRTAASNKLNLPQKRCTLAVFVKKGITLTDIKKRIDYPPKEKRSNNAFILIEGKVTKEGKGSAPLSISVSSVHLNSRNDNIRRAHANYFFDNQKFTNTKKTYTDVLQEAKRFHLIMGDFNERDYLMKDNTVTDRGYLTNFTSYGYDFSKKQGRKNPMSVYGTYGYTKLGDTQPTALKDPRDRKHNAKGGFLDQIIITSGLPIKSEAEHYGAVITDKNEFDPKNKLFYSGSDHLPVMRYFNVTIPGSGADEKIVKDYIKRRLPNFDKEIQSIKDIIQIKDVDSIKLKSRKLMFYDSKESVDEFLKKMSNLNSLSIGVHKKLELKKLDLEGLQRQIKNLSNEIDKSHNKNFLEAVYNKITTCNKSRNLSLEKMDDNKATVKWYIPNSLSEDNFNEYQSTLAELNRMS